MCGGTHVWSPQNNLKCHSSGAVHHVFLRKSLPLAKVDACSLNIPFEGFPICVIDDSFMTAEHM